MASPTVTYTFVNGQTSDGPQVSQNFTDIINALTDTSKDLSVNKVTAATSIISPLFQSTTSNVASAGQIRLANGDTIKFRNAGNSADIAFAVGSTDSIASYAAIDLVNISSTQTLTNKTLSGNTAVTLISGSGTLTLNTSGTITVPNATDTLVGKATTDTLTNKTLTSPSIATPTITGTAAMANLTLTTTGGSATALDYYEEGTFTANFNQNAGASGSGTSFTVSFIRIGKIVALRFPNMTAMTIGSTSVALSTASGTIPTRLRPTVGIYGSYLAEVGATGLLNSLGVYNIEINGAIDLYKDGTLATNWTATNTNNGAFGFTAVYTIQ